MSGCKPSPEGLAEDKVKVRGVVDEKATDITEIWPGILKDCLLSVAQIRA